MTPLKVLPLFEIPISVKCSPSFSSTAFLPTRKFRKVFLSSFNCSTLLSPHFARSTFQKALRLRTSVFRASKTAQQPKSNLSEKDAKREDDDPFAVDEEERQELRREIRQVLDMNPHVDQEIDPTERKKKMEQLLAEYPLVVEEDDPDWPDDADGWGFNLGQFFNKITIKNAKKKDDDDDDNYDSENELVWQDDDYIQPIKDITTAEWEETVFKDISPLVVLVHNRYKRPKENEKLRSELEKAIHIIWNCRLPSPRTVAVDAVREIDLVSALQISVFPELIFTKAGKIIHREKEILTADQLSKIMAFFYYGAAKPPCLNASENTEDAIPAVSIGSQDC